MKKISLTFYWLFWIIYLESIYRIFIIGNFFSTSTLNVLLFTLFWVFIYSIITRLFNEKVNRLISILLLSFTVLITLAQIVYFNFYNSIFSFFSLTTGTGQVMQFWKMILEVIIRIWYVFVLVLIPYILFLIFNKKIVNYRKYSNNGFIIMSSIIVSISCCIFLNIKLSTKGIYSLNNLIFKTHAPILTIEKTGLYSMQAIDMYRYFFGFEEVPIEEEVIIDIPIDEPEEILPEYNVYNINFDDLISKEKNKKIINIHNYMKGVLPTEKNEYTGMFKGKNLVYITAEAFDTIAINKDITPTLYKMANEGVVFKNFYQPSFPVSTSDGEYMNVMSLIPKEGLWSFSKTSKLDMKYALGNMFKNDGYLTYGFHNHTYKYYDRNKSHPNIGLKFIGCGNGLQKKMNCKHWPNSDNEMIKSTIDYYMDKGKPFMTYYMTVSGHLNYNFPGNNMASRHKKEVSSLKYSDAAKAYLATQRELDLAMETLLKELEIRGILEDTVIVIAPDHYPYGLKVKEINELSSFNRDDKFELYHSSMILYNPKFEGIVIEDTVSGIDILPTMYNLFGIDYDSRLYMGRDIFDKDDHIVILSNRSWITRKGRYNSVSKKFISNGEEVDSDYINKINSIVSSRFSVSSSILDTNYYSKVVKYVTPSE